MLEVIDSHKQDEIIEVLKQQQLELRSQVEEVSVDMWACFPKVIAEVFPNAVVVIDRFHVMKLVLQRLNKLRQVVGIKAKGSRFLLLKKYSDLTEKETAKLKQVLAQSA